MVPAQRRQPHGLSGTEGEHPSHQLRLELREPHVESREAVLQVCVESRKSEFVQLAELRSAVAVDSVQPIHQFIRKAPSRYSGRQHFYTVTPYRSANNFT